MSRIASRDPAAPRLTGRLSRSDLLWVANTTHGPAGHWHARPRDGAPDHDHLAAADDARRYLADHRVPVPAGRPGPGTLDELRLVRGAVHGLLRDGARRDPWTPELLAVLAEARYGVGPDGRISSLEAGWPGLARDLLLPLVDLVVQGARLGRCANPSCRLVFEDGSRNHSRRWCDPAGCGNRDRVRRSRTGSGPARGVRAAPAG